MLFLWSWGGEWECVVLGLVVLVGVGPGASGVVEVEVELVGQLVWVVVLVTDACWGAAEDGLCDGSG